MGTVTAEGESSPSLEAWLTEIGAAEALAPLRNEEFDTVAALRDLTSSTGEEGLADIEGASSHAVVALLVAVICVLHLFSSVRH